MYFGRNYTINTIPYDERLLNTPITDYRKNAISLILAPYLINIRGLSDTEAIYRIGEWIMKCDQVKELAPDTSHFDILIIKAIERCRNNGIKPLKSETLQHKNKMLYTNLEYYSLKPLVRMMS